MSGSAKEFMANSFPAHSLPFHVLAWGFDSWCPQTEIFFRTGWLQIPSALQQQMSGSFRKDLAASSPLFGADQPAWLQEALNNWRRQARHSRPVLSMTQVNTHFEHKAFIPSLFPLSLRSSTPWACICLALMASRLGLKCRLRSSFLTQCRGTLRHLRKSYSKINPLASSTEYRQSDSRSGWGAVGLVTKCGDWEQN